MNEADMKYDVPPDSPLREKVLLNAIQFTINDRELDYGGPEDSFGAIADYWNDYLKHKLEAEGACLLIDAYDVATMMLLLKVARMEKRPTSTDSMADAAGYAACAAEVLHRQQTIPANPQPPRPARTVEDALD